VSPETVDVELPKDGTGHVVRRGLMLTAKILQNLANNLFFAKEPHMASLNDFMAENVVVVTSYLSEVNVRQFLLLITFHLMNKPRNTP
jgi:hypothetical protein